MWCEAAQCCRGARQNSEFSTKRLSADNRIHDSLNHLCCSLNWREGKVRRVRTTKGNRNGHIQTGAKAKQCHGEALGAGPQSTNHDKKTSQQWDSAAESGNTINSKMLCCCGTSWLILTNQLSTRGHRSKDTQQLLKSWNTVFLVSLFASIIF